MGRADAPASQSSATEARSLIKKHLIQVRAFPGRPHDSQPGWRPEELPSFHNSQCWLGRYGGDALMDLIGWTSPRPPCLRGYRSKTTPELTTTTEGQSQSSSVNIMVQHVRHDRTNRNTHTNSRARATGTSEFGTCSHQYTLLSFYRPSMQD